MGDFEVHKSWLALTGLVLSLLFGGCHKLLGDYTIDQDAQTACVQGAWRCVGNILQTCRDVDTNWGNSAVCASEALCDATQGICRPPTCATGDRLCVGAELRTCNETRDGWTTLQTCASAALCSTKSDACALEPCTAGTFECNGAVLRVCSDDQSGWQDRDTCASSALCDGDAGACHDSVCQAGEFRCRGAILEACNQALDGWTTLTTCDSAALCDSDAGSCGAGACTSAGAFRCDDDGTLERCADDLTSWVMVASCPSAAYCDAMGGSCTDAPCTPGAKQCSGGDLQQCTSTGWKTVTSCATDGLCLQALGGGSDKCPTPVCATGETQCVGEQPQICNPDRTGFKPNGSPCASAELCSGESGTCATPVCSAGQTRCKGAQPEVCSAGLSGFVASGAACASTALCKADTGTCGDQKCSAGQLRCDPANPTHLQRCNSDLTGWESTPCDICATAELCSASLGATTCDASSCQEPVCNAGEPSCGGSGSDQGKLLQVCNAGRTGYTMCATCVTPELCDASRGSKPFTCGPSACVAPSCSPSDRWCGGKDNRTLYQCPPSRINSQATALDTCETSGLCELSHQEGKATCEEPSCNLGDLWCGGKDNATIYQCPTSRINSQATALDTCKSSKLCDTAVKNRSTTCPAPVCDAGATQCAGSAKSTLQMCSADGSGFTDCDVCSTAELCTASLGATSCTTDACMGCMPGDARCNADGDYETCRSNGSGYKVTKCKGLGCVELLGGCVLGGSAGASGG